MSITLDRPPSPPRPARPDSDPEFRATPQPPATPLSRPQRKKSLLQRYQSHLLIAGLSVVVTAIALSPLVLGSMSRSTASSTQAPARTTAAAGANVTTNVAITASEFKFSPASIQVPVGQRVTFTLNNTGVVEHDVTVQGTGFSLKANPGQTATGQFTFDKPGVFDLFCSVPGHKDAGMKGTLTVVDPNAVVRLFSRRLLELRHRSRTCQA